ncbi:hypothetical protein BH09MYX1_BH09MYX1_49140 [soil metagenome]
MSEEKKTKTNPSDAPASKKASAKSAPAKAAPANVVPKTPAKNSEGDYMLPERWTGIWKIFAGIAVVGIAGAGWGYAVDPTRFAYAWLVGFLVALTVGLGAIFFILIQHLTSAGWSVTVRRVSEFFAAGTPALLVLVIPVALFAPTLFGSWMNAGHTGQGEHTAPKVEKKDEHSQLPAPHAAMTLAQNDVPAPTQTTDAVPVVPVAQPTATVVAPAARPAVRPAAVASALAAPQTTLTPAKVAFAQGRKDIDAAGKTALEPVANFLRANPTARIDVSGYTDKVGDPQKNAELAKDRAKTVRDVLVDMGVEQDRIYMKPPEAITGEGHDHEARRVEITLATAAIVPVVPGPAVKMTERRSEPEEVPVITKKDHGDPEEVIEEENMSKKTWWLSKGFFYGRILVYILVWIVLGVSLLRTSASQDKSNDLEVTNTLARMSPPYVILFALSLTGAAFDWIMSLDPTWYSTIFGVTFFSGAAVVGFATLVIVFTSMRQSGILTREVTVEHYHDLGKLMFGFMCFWAYVSFSQFMLIWYAAIPEETTFFHHRWDGEGPWKTVSLLLIFFHFAVPFVAIMSRNVKRRLGLLRAGAIRLLTMHVVEVYWLVMPNVPLPAGATFGFHPMDIFCLIGPVGAYLAVVFYTMTKYPIIPIGDPRLERSLKFENA